MLFDFKQEEKNNKLKWFQVYTFNMVFTDQPNYF